VAPAPRRVHRTRHTNRRVHRSPHRVHAPRR
jgi:hypothetical protein